MNRLFLSSVLLAVMVLGACTKVARQNPYDPQAPDTVQAKATVSGYASLEGDQPGTISIVATAAHAGPARRVETQAAADGSFLLELPPDSYNLQISSETFATFALSGLALQPGDSYDLGRITLTAAKGALTGSVLVQDGPARDGAPAGGTQVLLAHEQGGVYVTATGADGHFRADGLRAGRYTVHCSRESYAPGYLPDDIVVEGDQTAEAPPVTLYPASAVVQLKANGVLGGRFSNQRAIEVQLLAFVERLTSMRVSEDKTFGDASLGDTEYRDFAASLAFTLSDSDGSHAIYAQFRDDKGLESDVFSATLILDRVAPDIAALVVGSGASFATSAIVSVEIKANDSGSGTRGYQLAVGSDLSATPESAALAAPGGATINTTLSLGSDGNKTISAVVIDQAGNVSAPSSATIYKDTVAPLTAPPALSVNGTAGGTVTVYDTRVTLTFGVTGDRPNEPLYVALANASGLNALSPKLTLSSAMAFDLLQGSDGPRTVCALFTDLAGNASGEVCQALSLDRTGGLTGTVTLEDSSDFTLLSANIAPSTAPASQTAALINPATGTFTFAGIPAGSGYVLTLHVPGYADVVENDVTIQAGLVPNRGTYFLERARTSMHGIARFADKAAGGNEHAGIIISDRNDPTNTAVTGETGAWKLERIPVIATYDLRASASGYVAQDFSVIGLAENENRDLGTRTLQKLQGDFTVCAAATPACDSSHGILFTKSKTVTLGLLHPTATGYWVSESSTLPVGASSACSLAGGCTVSFDVTDGVAGGGSDGVRPIHVWYDLDGAGTASPMFTAQVTIDQTPPTGGSISIDGGATYSTNAAALATLTLSASDALSGMGDMVLSNDTTFDGSDTVLGYGTTVNGYVMDNSASTATVSVYAKFCDVVGNCVADASAAVDTIQLDRDPPSAGSGVTFSIDAGAATTNTPYVTLNIGAGDAVAARFGVAASLSNIAYVALPAGTSTFPFTLTSGDHPAKQVFAQFKDAAGNETTPAAFSDTIALDTQGPTAPFVSIDEGDATKLSTVHLTLSALGADQMIVHLGASADFTSDSWVAYATSHTLSIGPAEASYQVHVKFRDLAGNESAVVSDSIVYDITAPTLPSVQVALSAASNGIKYTSTSTVTLSLNAVGADFMTIAADGVIDTELPEPFSVLKSIVLSPTTPGVRTVAARFSDQAGNTTSVLTDTVTIDDTAPALTSFSVAPAPLTNTTNLTLTIAASDTAPIEMLLSNDAAYTGASWRAIESPLTWAVTAAPGTKTIYLKLRDLAGNVTTASPVTTTLDVSAPAITSVSLASGATYVTSGSNVALVIAVSDNLTSAPNLVLQASEDPTFASATTLSAASTTFTLSSGDGLKTVYVRARDEAGNYGYGSDTVSLDTQDPFGAALTLTATGAAEPATTGYAKAVTPIVATYAVVDGSQYCLTGDIVEADAGACAAGSSGWASFVQSQTLTLTSGPGSKNVTVRYRDAAQRTSSSVTQTIVLDTTAPSNAQPAPKVTLTGTDRNGASTTVTRTATVAGVLNGAGFTDATSGVYQMQVSESALFFGAVWQSASSNFPLPLTFGDGTKTVYVKTRDRAGNESAAVSGSIVLDTTPPDLTFTIRGEGAGGAVTTATSRLRDVTLALDLDDHSGSGVTATDTLLIDDDSSFTGASWQTYSATPSWNLVDSATLTCRSHVAINEVHTGAIAGTDWVEILNASAMTVDVTGWKFECGNAVSNVTWTLTSHQLTPDSTFVFAEDGPLGWTGGTSNRVFHGAQECPWDNGQGYGILYDAFGNVADFIRFNGSSKTAPAGVAWQESAALSGSNFSRALIGAVSFDRDTASDFCSTAATSTPNAANSTACGLIAADCADIDGPKTVYVKVRDLAGNETTAIASTYLDVTPPLAYLTINADIAFTTDRDVDLRIDGIDADTGVAAMMISESATVATSWETYVANTTHTLSAGDGARFVGVRLRDTAGNETPATWAPDYITLDTTVPNVLSATMSLTGLARGVDNTTLTQTAVVRLDIAGVTDNLAPTPSLPVIEMKLSEDSSFSGVSWQPYSDDPFFVLSSSDGIKTVYAKFRDFAGNESDPINGTIVLDTTPPSTAYVYLDDDGGGIDNATYSTDTTVQLRFWLDDTDAVDFRVLGDVTRPFAACSGGACSFNSASPETYTVSFDTAVQGNKNVGVAFKDLAGNVSTVFSDNIFLDSSAPTASPVITGATVRTTSIYIDFTDVTDPGAPISGSGIAGYLVNVSSHGSPLLTTTLTSSSGWITGLPSLDVYSFTVQAVDNAGNLGVASSTFTSQVGLTTAIMESAYGIGSLKDRILGYRGFLIFSPITGSLTQTIDTCDTRRDRCRDAGFTHVQVGASGSPPKDTLLAASNDGLWYFSYIFNGTSHVYTNRLRGKPDEIDGGWGTSMVDAFSVPNPSLAGTFAAAANGRVTAVAGFADATGQLGHSYANGAAGNLWIDIRSPNVDWQMSAVTLMDTTGDDPTANPALDDYRMNREANMLSLDAGEESLWLSWPAINDTGPVGVGDGLASTVADSDADIDSNGNSTRDCDDAGSDCAVAVMGCNTKTNDCLDASKWSKVRLRVNGAGTSGSYVFSTKVLEVGSYLYVAALGIVAGPPEQRGLLLWRCDVASGCDDVGDFTGPVTLKTLNQPILVNQGLQAPRLQLESWDNRLFSAVTDYGTGTVTLLNCVETTGHSCASAAAWTSADVLQAGDIRGQVDLAVQQGNVTLFVGRDATRAYVLEPDTPAPLNRALTPDLTGNGLHATWTPRSLDAVDGYRADTNTTNFNAATTTQDVKPDPSASEMLVPNTNRYGVVASYRDQDLGMAEPKFHAQTGGRVDSSNTTMDGSTMHYAETPTCHIVAYAHDGAGTSDVHVATRTKAGALWNVTSLTSVIGGTGPGTLSDISVSATKRASGNMRVHVSYAAYNYGISRWEVHHDWRTIDSSCNVGVTSHDAVVFTNGGGGPLGYLSMAINENTNDQAFISFTQDTSVTFSPGNEMSLLRCNFNNVASTGCNVSADFAAPATFGHDYTGGSLLIDGSTLYWIWQRHTNPMGPVHEYATYAWRCSLAGDCGSAANWPAAQTNAMVFETQNDTRRQAFTARVTNNTLHVSSTFGHSARCTLSVPATDQCADGTTGLAGNARAWSRTFYSAESLSSFAPLMGMQASTSSGQLAYVGLGNDGHSIARCRNRCWLPDNWFGGYTSRSPETGTTLEGTATSFDSFGTFDPLTNKFSLAFRFRLSQDPRHSKWAFMSDLLFEYKSPLEP